MYDRLPLYVPVGWSSLMYDRLPLYVPVGWSSVFVLITEWYGLESLMFESVATVCTSGVVFSICFKH